MLKYDSNGLIVAIAQDAINGEVRMVAWMNRESLDKTLRTGKATFFSRSRQALWTKGETSGHFLSVQSVHADCDADTLLLRVIPNGPSCHTGRPTCFFRRVEGDKLVDDKVPSGSFLEALEHEIQQRATSGSVEKSYTKYLLDGGVDKVNEKVREEADEFCEALSNETPERVASEAADILYHMLVGLQLRGVEWRQVIEVLAARSGVSGLVEKASRNQSATDT